MDSNGGLVYIVDDDVSVRQGLAGLVASAGWTAKTAASSQEFLDMVRPEVPSCLVLDVELPGLSGIDLQRELTRSGIQIPIIFLTGHGNIPMTVHAIKAGAADFLTKPFDDEELLSAIRQCIARYDAPHLEVRSQLKELRKEKLEVEEKLNGENALIIGTSSALRHVLQLVETVAQTDSTVLLLGETGTGKELIAQALRDKSRRKDAKFVKLNCAAIPSGLLESELFGHEKGAFTGAFTQKVGRLELADRGTLFLDEVGDIPLEIQPKLLRALQEREFERLGSAQTRRADVRLIAATNRDLEVMVREQKFRSDLFYRLNVFPIQLPPLRERQSDIPLLVERFAEHFSKRMNKVISAIPSITMENLCRYSWPGNIRELQNVIERAVIISTGPTLEIDMGNLKFSKSTSSLETPSRAGWTNSGLRDVLAKTERQQILKALEECNWILGGPNGAAAFLGMNRSTLRLRMQKLGLSRRSA
jgi:DNA-binding NtrC family response regulator